MSFYDDLIGHAMRSQESPRSITATQVQQQLADNMFRTYALGMDIAAGPAFTNTNMPTRPSPTKQLEKLKHESGELEVDLENQILKTNSEQISFDIDSHKKKILLEGLDDISQTLQFEDNILEFEKQSKVPSVL